ncbi:multidrug transporter [Hahella sp. CCB-MM4]|uniref:efflux RND transporter permease subunit n=1 Tax=Hahella sp. (strain CCB-MM4) TaxID=1926491 RepID=UPI000B9B3825|nr:efflux RND transporter permease subunit [Hahella sp. CCB-MM4]OZG69748.1 multidrug transporter [Hahella sp. CCB-MM4]
MHMLTSWFIRNPVAANLVMGLILIAGWLTATSIRIEGFPKLPADTLQIDTPFTDAYAGQVDEQITQRIEKAIEGVAGIKKVQAVSMEGLSSISVQKQPGYDLDRLATDVRTRLDSIYGLPAKAEKPVITRNDFDLPAQIVQLYGNTDPATIQRLGRRVREALLAKPEISKIKTWGERQAEINVEINPEKLQEFQLTLYEVAAKIQQASLTFKAGELKTVGGNIRLRADDQAYHAKEFAAISIKVRADGSRILLSDLASVVDGFENSDSLVRFNGQPAIGMEVQIGRKENLLEIAEVIKTTIEELQPILPPEVRLVSWADSSRYISERLQLLKSNAVQGLLLVFLLLALFLNLKLAFWVAMGVPISVAGAMAIMGSDWVGYSLNDITTFGLIIALGILVDDAVVVGESVFEERRKIADPIKGTEVGVGKVATATIFGVMTTVAAFFPMMLIDNALGKVLAGFSGVVIMALMLSLFESKFILPAHLAGIRISHEGKSGSLWSRVQSGAQRLLNGFNHRIYGPVLEFAIKRRYSVLVLFISMATLGLGFMESGQVRMVFFPEIPGQTITVRMEMDPRAPHRLTVANADRIEAAGVALNNELASRYALESNPIKHFLVAVNDSESVDIYAELALPEDRPGIATLDIMRQWQSAVGTLEGTTELTFNASEETGGGFAIQLFSKDEASLISASNELRDYLLAFDGVSNLRDDLKQGKPQLYLKLKPEAIHLGFTNEILASQIGARFGGMEVQRLYRDGQEVKVMIKDGLEYRDTVADLLDARVLNDKGQWFPVMSVASIESSYATDYISRRDGERVNTLRAALDKSLVSPSELGAALFENIVPQLKQRYPLVKITTSGELEEIGNIRGGLIKALIFTCVLIYALLAIPLKSYWQPFVIMSVIPFGFIGAAMGHLIMDVPLSILSFFGMLALAGVVVNDSLVMMTRYNQAREEGETVHKALQLAGLGRFQAIFLTTVTTVAGLSPLMMETSEQAQYLIPAAISLAYGEIFATAITLILIPLLIAISHDLATLFRRQNVDAKPQACDIEG